jgi:hypothetical protein
MAQPLCYKDQNRNDEYGTNTQKQPLKILLFPSGDRCLLDYDLLLNYFCFLIRDPGAANQKPVGVDAHGSACYQRAKILPWFNP